MRLINCCTTPTHGRSCRTGESWQLQTLLASVCVLALEYALGQVSPGPNRRRTKLSHKLYQSVVSLHPNLDVRTYYYLGANPKSVDAKPGARCFHAHELRHVHNAQCDVSNVPFVVQAPLNRPCPLRAAG